jgi:putative hemolysin
MTANRIAREVSYASSAGTPTGRVVVRALENATGRLSLIRRARGYESEIAAGRDFWDVICARYGIGLDVVGGSLDRIPRTGPLVVVANHPFGVLDGLAMGRILSERRGRGFRILAHKIFARAPELADVVLPVSFDDTREALAANLQTRAEALRTLAGGGAIGIFPGGAVSTAARPMGVPLDPTWRTFTAKMIARSDATVVPVFFDGHNSRMFQIASHLHYTLRLGMLLREFRARTGTRVRVVVGEPVLRETLDSLRGDARAMMLYLRRTTYALSPTPLPFDGAGFEWDAKPKAFDKTLPSG